MMEILSHEIAGEVRMRRDGGREMWEMGEIGVIRWEEVDGLAYRIGWS